MFGMEGRTVGRKVGLLVNFIFVLITLIVIVGCAKDGRDGAPGDSVPGEPGTPGIPGNDGDDGANTPLRLYEPRPSTVDECPYGGTTIDTYLDMNWSEAYEIDFDKNFVSIPSCNGPPGETITDPDCDDDRRIVLCHKRKQTKWIDRDRVDDHLDHGDTLGECRY